MRAKVSRGQFIFSGSEPESYLFQTILNHSWPLRHMTAVYHWWERLPEMKRALERWGERLERMVTGRESAKVVKIR